MTAHPITTRDAWLKARIALLEQEKAHTLAQDDLANARRALPWVRIDKDYVFQSDAGPVTLGDLFAGHRQLVVHHYMFGANSTEGCQICSFMADGYDRLHTHLAGRDTALAMVSTAPVDRLMAYRARMGWSTRWVSSGGTTFNQDFGVTFTQEELESPDYVYNYTGTFRHGPEAPGLSVFLKEEDGTIYHTYSTYGRGVESAMPVYQLLDLTPLGRDEADLPFPMAWVRRHDAYTSQAAPTAAE